MMKDLFLFRLLVQLIITGYMLTSMTYQGHNCMLDNSPITENDAKKVGILFPIPTIVWYLGPQNITNENCE